MTAMITISWISSITFMQLTCTLAQLTLLSCLRLGTDLYSVNTAFVSFGYQKSYAFVICIQCVT